jgi:hypothetical protein
MSFPKDIRNTLWVRTFGESYAGTCQVCDRKITITEFDVGHIVARVKGGLDTIHNLKPICRPCNSGMRTNNLYQYKARFYPSINVEDIIRKFSSISTEELLQIQAHLDKVIETRKETEDRYDELEMIEDLTLTDSDDESESESDDTHVDISKTKKPTYCTFIITKGMMTTTCDNKISDGHCFCTRCRNNPDAINQLCD